MERCSSCGEEPRVASPSTLDGRVPGVTLGHACLEKLSGQEKEVALQALRDNGCGRLAGRIAPPKITREATPATPKAATVRKRKA